VLQIYRLALLARLLDDFGGAEFQKQKLLMAHGGLIILFRPMKMALIQRFVYKYKIGAEARERKVTESLIT
jgi:hypothetical protein